MNSTSIRRMMVAVGLIGLLAAGLAPLAQAATYNWAATGDGDSEYWTNGTPAWGTADYPDHADAAYINTDNANNYTCIVDTVITDGAEYINPFYLDNTGGGSATLSITNGGRLRVYDGSLNTGARLLVSGEGSAFKKGSNFYMGGQNGVLRFENGADFHGANSGGIGLGGGPWSNSEGGQNWSLIVTGSGTTFTNDGAWLYVGKSNTSGTHVPAVSNSVYVLDGARWKASATIGGSGPSNTYNTVTVSGVGTYFQSGISIGASVGSSYNSLTISNGVTADLGNGTKYVGSGVGANYNELNIGAAGGAAVTVTGQYNDYVGYGGAAFNSLTLENATWTRSGNYRTMYVGNASPSNTITINDGGTWNGNSQDSISVGNDAAAGNTLTVNAGGVVTNLVGLRVGSGTGPSGNRAIIDGGSVYTVNTAAWTYPGVYVNGGTDNQVIVQNGGVLEAYKMVVAAGAGNTITNSGGIYQFPIVNPTITAGGDGIFINGGTLSFRGVSSGLDITDHLSAPFTSMTWLGENTLRLNDSHLTSGLGYTFNTGQGATHWVRLEMVGSTPEVKLLGFTIGANGSMLVDDDTAATVAGVVTNLGTMEILSGTLTCSSDLELDSGGTTLVGLQETDNGSVTISGTFTAGGTLTVTNTTGFVFAGGLNWDLFDWTGGTISFAATNLPTLDAGLEWDTSQLGSDGIVAVASVGGGVVTNIWDGDSGMSWGTAASWAEGHVPTPAEVVRITTDNSPPVWPVLDQARDVPVLLLETGAQLSLGGNDLTISSNIVMDGTLVASGSETVTLQGDADLNGGTLTAASSTVLVGGTAAQTLDFGGITFNALLSTNASAVTFNGGFNAADFTCLAPGATLTFENGATFDVTNLKLNGASGSLLTLQSDASPAKWNLNVSGASSVTWVDVSDSDAGGGLTIYPVASNNGGNNPNWVFGSGSWKVWTGGTTDFALGSNWDPVGAPDATSRLFIGTTNGIAAPLLTSPDTVAELAIGGQDSASLELQAALTVTGRVAILPDGVLTHTANATTEQYKLDLTVGGDLEIASGGAINADGKGYRGGSGPSPGDIDISGYWGGTHGGMGGAQSSTYATNHVTYGSVTNPTTLGSGGSSRAGTFTRTGGGAVILQVTGATVVNGSISAEGTRSENLVSGGAGGSVNLRTATLSGSGTIQADGGVQDTVGNARWGGGGGRVAVRLTSGSTFDAVTIRALGGSGGGGQDMRGAPGTVYLQTASQGEGNGDTIVDADGLTTPAFITTTISTNLVDAGVGSVIARDNAKLVVQTNATLNISGSLTNDATSTVTLDTGSTVAFVGTGASTVWGSHGWYDLTIDTAGKVVSFEAGETQTVNGTPTFDNGVTLQSTQSGVQWILTVPGTPVVEEQEVGLVEVHDSNASGGKTMSAGPTSNVSDNNLNWEVRPGGTLFKFR